MKQPDQEQLNELCQQREVNRRQRLRDEIASKRNDIERNVNDPLEEGVESKPYGLQWELRGAAEDVWFHILNWVSEPSSIKNLWEVCQMFRGLLRRKYVETMLPEITKLIENERPKYLLRDNFEDDIDDYNGAEYYYDRIERGRIYFALCLVSKQCKRSLEHHWAFFMEITTAEKIHEILETIKRDTFNTETLHPLEIDICEADISDNLGGDEEYAEFHETITIFLGLVGKRVHKLYYTPYQTMSKNVYDCLRKWVGLTPNLKSLALWSASTNDEIAPIIELKDIEPFPRCPSLSYFHEGSNALPRPYIQRILEASPGIMDLRVKKHSTQVLDKLIELTKLYICPDLSLFGHHHLSWKLKKLILEAPFRFSGDQTKIKVSSRKLFKFLEQFGNTLEHLEVTIHVTNSAGEYLRLPNLITLKWKQRTSFKNMDFLLYAEKLETLQVRVTKRFMTGKSLSEKYKRIVGDESGSFLGKSVWEVFPYLKLIRVVPYNYWDHLGGECFEECRKVES